MSLKDKVERVEVFEDHIVFSKNFYNPKDVKEAVIQTIREIDTCFTGLTGDSDMECGLLTALKIIKENFGDYEE